MTKSTQIAELRVLADDELDGVAGAKDTPRGTLLGAQGLNPYLDAVIEGVVKGYPVPMGHSTTVIH